MANDDIIFALFAAHTLRDESFVRHHGGEPLVLADDGNIHRLNELINKAAGLLGLKGVGAVEIDGQAAHYCRCALFLCKRSEGLNILLKTLAEVRLRGQGVCIEGVGDGHAYALITDVECDITFHVAIKLYHTEGPPSIEIETKSGAPAAAAGAPRTGGEQTRQKSSKKARRRAHFKRSI